MKTSACLPRSLGLSGTPRLRAALHVLLEAHFLAHDCARTPWVFAVPIDQLQAVGLSQSDLRWRACMDYVEAAVEQVARGRGQRSFGKRGTLSFQARTCFILSAAGLRWAETTGTGCQRRRRGSQALLPCYDASARLLRVGGVVVKEFRLSVWLLPVLCAFQAFPLASSAMSDAVTLERGAASLRGRVVGLFLSIPGTAASTSPWLMGWWKPRATRISATTQRFLTQNSTSKATTGFTTRSSQNRILTRSSA